MNTFRIALIFAVIFTSTSVPIGAWTDVAIAQVDSSASYFEIDADDGSRLRNVNRPDDETNTDATTSYRSGTWEVVDGDSQTYGRRQDESCQNWRHSDYEPYQGRSSYLVQCDEKPDCADNPRHLPCVDRVKCDHQRAYPEYQCPARRSEQMILSDWTVLDKDREPDPKRYFSLSFRLNTLPAIPTDGGEKGGFIAQLHQGGSGSPPFKIAWAMKDGELYLEAGMYGQISTVIDFCQVGFSCKPGLPFYEPLIGKDDAIPQLPFLPLEVNVWYHLMIEITLSGQVNLQGCPVYLDKSKGHVTVWLMDSRSGDWKQFTSLPAAVGYVTKGNDLVPRTGTDCEFQWKVGIYANAYDPIVMYLDNVAYGKRFDDITRNDLIGGKKTVFALPLDEGSGRTASDSSGYDNDGTVQGTEHWNPDGAECSTSSMRFTGQNSVQVPLDPVDLEFGNFVTLSAWVRPASLTEDDTGIVLVDGSADFSRIVLSMSKDRILFGVRHPADTRFFPAEFKFPEGFFADNDWHQIVGTYNRFGDDRRGANILFVDGTEVARDYTSPLPIARSQTHLVVGSSGTGGFVGDIDEVTIRNYVMTPRDSRPSAAGNEASTCAQNPEASYAPSSAGGDQQAAAVGRPAHPLGFVTTLQ